jgi:hypothetical protein
MEHLSLTDVLFVTSILKYGTSLSDECMARYQHIEILNIFLWRMYSSLSTYWNMEHLFLTDVLFVISILKYGTSFSDWYNVRYHHIEIWKIFLWRMYCSLWAYRKPAQSSLRAASLLFVISVPRYRTFFPYSGALNYQGVEISQILYWQLYCSLSTYRCIEHSSLMSELYTNPSSI